MSADHDFSATCVVALINIGDRNLKICVSQGTQRYTEMQAIVHHRSRSSFVASTDATSQTGPRDGKHQVSLSGGGRGYPGHAPARRDLFGVPSPPPQKGGLLAMSKMIAAL